MLNKFLKAINKNTVIVAIIVAISPIVAFILLIFLKFNPVEFIRKFGNLGTIFYNYININNLNHTINYTITIVIVNSFVCMFVFSPDINITIRNKSMKDDISILKNPSNPNHNPTSFITQIHIDYKGWIWYKLIEKLGGVIIKIETPDWAEPTLSNKPWDNSSYSDDNFKNLVQVDITKALNKNLEDYKGEVFVGFDIITNTNITSYKEAPIEVSILNRSNGRINNLILSFLIRNVFSIEYKKHQIRIDY